MIKHLVIIPYVGWGDTITVFQATAESVEAAVASFTQEREMRGARRLDTKILDFPYDTDAGYFPLPFPAIHPLKEEAK
jgi:hypothetical protein